MSFLYTEEFIPNGQERHWPVSLYQAGKLRLQAVGDRRFYCGLFDEATHNRATARGRGPFPFLFTSDRTAFDRTYDNVQPGLYYVVVRVGIFNPPGGNVRVVLDRTWG